MRHENGRSRIPATNSNEFRSRIPAIDDCPDPEELAVVRRERPVRVKGQPQMEYWIESLDMPESTQEVIWKDWEARVLEQGVRKEGKVFLEGLLRARWLGFF